MHYEVRIVHHATGEVVCDADLEAMECRETARFQLQARPECANELSRAVEDVLDEQRVFDETMDRAERRRLRISRLSLAAAVLGGLIALLVMSDAFGIAIPS